MIKRRKLIRGDKKQLDNLLREFRIAVDEVTELHKLIMENKFKEVLDR